MALKMYIMTHKEFDAPKEKFYCPLLVGKALYKGKSLPYLGDDTGENISKENPYYSELTGVYWVWKNDLSSEEIGICHYRRYFISEQEKVFSERELQEMLERYDLITTRSLTLPNTYYEGFGKKHHIEDLQAVEEAIGRKYPEYLPTFLQVVHQKETYFGNMMVAKKTLFDKYAAWLFGIFQEASKNIHPETYDNYSKRVYGFLSEMLLMVWVRHNHLHPYESRVGVIGEKAETKELKLSLAAYFARGDMRGAKKFFQEYLKKKPDVLMEASDTTGELKLAMQAISTWEYEELEGKHSNAANCSDFYQVLSFYTKLNQMVLKVGAAKETEEDWRWLQKEHLTRKAVEIATKLFLTDATMQKQVYETMVKYI